MRFSLIAAPLELGCGTTGCAMGGAALIGGENGLLSFLNQNGIHAAADSAFVPMTARREGEPAPHYLQEVVTACCATRDAVSLAQGEGTFPLTLGGDHALGLGTVAGTAQHYSPEELSLVWVDAHTDINTEKSSTSGNIHGMPIAALLGLCGPELTAVCGGAAVLRPENVHIIFARDIDPAEEEIIAGQGVHLYRMSEITEKGLTAVTERLLGSITTPYCHVSWDVDSLDWKDYDGLGFLAGKTLLDAQEGSFQAVLQAHTDLDVPVIQVSMQTLDAAGVGELFYFFEFACGVSGYVLGVNPFNQPGVEVYKKNMFRLLGKN